MAGRWSCRRSTTPTIKHSLTRRAALARMLTRWRSAIAWESTSIDVVRATVGKFDPQQVTQEYAALLKQYGVSRVVGDAYAAEWSAGTWARCGVSYVRSELAKSEVYIECLPLFARGLLRLPDHAKLLRELRLLERHTHRSGRDTVDHPKGGRDDCANAMCGVAWQLSANSSAWMSSANMRRVIAEIALRPPYRRPMNTPERRRAMAEAMIGERRLAQLARARGR
jgi:hypothetical protein